MIKEVKTISRMARRLMIETLLWLASSIEDLEKKTDVKILTLSTYCSG